jgi:two-component system sensor histidine kinase KdpD
MPDASSHKQRAINPTHHPADRHERRVFPQYMMAMAVVLGITLLALFLQKVVGYRAIALIYLLGVVLLALFVDRGPTLLAATLSALFWDFFFLAPIANLRIANAEDAILFGMYFVVALVLGQLTARIRAQERTEREREQRSTALYLLTRDLVEATNLDQLVGNAVRQVERAFATRVAVMLPDLARSLGFSVHSASSYDITGPEQPVANWVFEHGLSAGKFTENLPGGETLFVPLATGGRTLAVMGLHLDQSTPLTSHQRDLLQAFSQQVALALDRQRLREQSENAKLLAESERLSKALLNSVSHEIRTPLAAIQSATGTLSELEERALTEAQRSLVGEIQQATDRLNVLVGKVLDITRLETGAVKPNLKLCDVNDLVHLAVKETRNLLRNHKLEVDVAPGLPLALVDYVLLQEALKNLLANAAHHTPVGTSVQVTVRARDGMLVLTVADRGPGIPPALLQRIFDKFSRGSNAPTGGTGLGLAIVKGFIESQAGEVTAENRPGGGAAFTIRLPLAQMASGAAMEHCESVHRTQINSPGNRG